MGLSIKGIGIEIILAPPSLYLIPLLETVKNGIKVSAQNCYNKNSGAYTGEIRLVQTVLLRGIVFLNLGSFFQSDAARQRRNPICHSWYAALICLI